MPLENGKIRQKNSPQRRSDRDSQSIDDIHFKNVTTNIIKLFIPISLCMLIVVTTTKSIPSVVETGTTYFQLSSINFQESNEGIFDTFLDAVINSLIFIGITIVSTTIFVILYVYKFYKVLVVFLFIAALIILFGLTLYFLCEVLKAINIPVDIFSVIVFYWNICVTAITCLFWRGPLKLQQAYLIFMCAGAAIILISFLPEWTTWVILFTLSIWDIIAVLAPHGPLKKLIETFIERDDMEFPTLIYSTLVYDALTTSTDEYHHRNEPVEDGDTLSAVEEYNNESSESNQQNNSTRSSRANSRSSRKRKRSSKKSKRKEQSEGFKLGLGDFIFYSVLIGKVSLNTVHFLSTFACFLAILIGLCFTLFLLMSFRKALPALPISIAFGMVFYFFHYLVEPLAELLAVKQIFL